MFQLATRSHVIGTDDRAWIDPGRRVTGRRYVSDVATDDDKWEQYEEALVSVFDENDTVIWASERGGLIDDVADRSAPEWVITAHNPRGVVQDDAENAEANKRLRIELERRGIPMLRAVGESPTTPGEPHHQEASFAVDCSDEEIFELARLFDQDAVFRLYDSEIEIWDCNGVERFHRHEEDEDESCEACDGIEELMVDNAKAGMAPYESMGYVFGYSDACEMCGRSIDAAEAFEVHEGLESRSKGGPAG